MDTGWLWWELLSLLSLCLSHSPFLHLSFPPHPSLIIPSLCSSLYTETSFFSTEEPSLCGRESDHCQLQLIASLITVHGGWISLPLSLYPTPPECSDWALLSHILSPLTNHYERGGGLMWPWLHTHPFSQAQARDIGSLTRITWLDRGRSSLPKKETWKRGARQIKEAY